jgi:cell division protein FtsI (penicillin-binding protein 3)
MKASIIFVAAMMILSACNMKQENTEQVSAIDNTLQAKVTSIMEGKLKEFDAQSGRVIVMDIQTGQVKASYGKDITAPYRSELVCPATLLAALKTGKVHLGDTIDTGNGVCIVGNDTLFDNNWRRGGYGKMTVRQAFAQNSVVGIYKMAVKAFSDNMEEYLSKVREIYRMTGDTTSLIVFANHGEWAIVTPMLTLALVNKIAANEGNDSLKSVLRYAVTDGLGMKANTDKTEVAGISGTTRQEDGSYMAEFCGYFPFKNPQYSIIVAIHKKDIPVSGGAMAGSVFKEIAEYLSNR